MRVAHDLLESKLGISGTSIEAVREPSALLVMDETLGRVIVARSFTALRAGVRTGRLADRVSTTVLAITVSVFATESWITVLTVTFSF
jgi:hypothetical protein